ncbi:acetyltransferase [Oceanococcus atlanticus]|uniref:Acetyltransferase n=1 Tax=Oceanococcus atlanticus TaxID=1317117 RepID=A0A1Y1SBG0_9GAMM|nr:GNAT family N-acetyltransferase [Oceanococcus atlanticus]ORE85961.1 acetyltransferase [Oceanococcus atlanticus]
MALRYQRLNPHNAEDVQAYQAMLEQAPEYHRVVSGQPAARDAAARDMLLLPQGKQLVDKFSLLIRENEVAVGCPDLVRAYPSKTSAFIGLLLFAEAHQGRGLGGEALGYVQCLAQSWGCTQLGIAVIPSNRKAMRFWQRAGFKETRRGNNPHFVADAVVMQAKLPLSSAL